MTHFTLSGFYAGIPICGAGKDSDAKYIHIALYGRPIPDDICQVCLDLWDNAGADETDLD